MRLPFSLFDFLGYALPGLIVVLLVILMTIFPSANQQTQVEFWRIQKSIDSTPTTSNQQESVMDRLIKYLPSHITSGIILILFCYVIGFIVHGCCDFFFKFMSGEYIGMSDRFGIMKKYYECIYSSNKLRCMKKYYTDNGWFEEELFNRLNRGCRDPSEHFNPYSKQFIRKLKKQIAEVFEIEVDGLKRPVEYTEIFHLCRNVIIKQNPDLYSRASTLQSRHESTKLMMFIFFLAALGFLLKGLFLILNGGLLLLYFAVASFGLGIVFLYMYNRLLRYYRNYILYGFYQYAMDLERSEPMVRID